jgi:hypothetical protein
MRTSPRPLDVRVTGVLGTVLACLLAPASALSQEEPLDSAEVLESVRDLQEDFERFRESKIPVEMERVGGTCDERIGRICIWFGGEEEETFPAEFREVGQARVELIRQLTDAFEQIKDRWVIGQMVHYLVETRNMAEAERIATECGIEETWWCSALLGYALHVRTEYVPAEKAFREALAAMPDDEWEEWTTPTYIFTEDAADDFNDQPFMEREEQFELFWKLSDPLFLFEGNDRLTDHFARWVVAKTSEDAAHPQGWDWDDDVEATLIRYGRNTGYSRTYNPGRTVGFGGGLNDTRRVVGHHHPKSRGYLFPEEFLTSPSEIPPESWITAPREARTWFAPLYAPDIKALETQVGRFRRDDQMLVVGAYRPTVPVDDAQSRVISAWNSDGGIVGEAHAALFLIPMNGEDPVYVQGSDPEGVLTIQTWPNRYVSGLEVVNLEGRQAWRARQGVVQLPLELGLVDVSDLMILREGSPLPDSFEEGLPNIRPGVRLKVGERFPIMWEVYGLRILEPVQVTIGFSQGRPGFLSRVGEFLGVIETEQPVDITFDDTGPDVVQSIFRSVEIELPDLEPGEYTLHLRLELRGRTPVVTSRPIVVER